MVGSLTELKDFQQSCGGDLLHVYLCQLFATMCGILGLMVHEKLGNIDTILP